MLDKACFCKITFQSCKENKPDHNVEHNRKGRHTVHIDLVSKGEDPDMQSREAEMILVQCLVDAKAKKESKTGMCDKKASRLGNEIMSLSIGAAITIP